MKSPLPHLIAPILSSILDSIESLRITVRTDGRKIYLDFPGHLSSLPVDLETRWIKLLSRHRGDIINLITARRKARELESSREAARIKLSEYEERMTQESLRVNDSHAIDW
jgi:hypothetical protein